MIEELLRKLRSGEITPTEHVETIIEAIEEKDEKINAFISTDFEAARKRAKELEKDEKKGKLYGLVFAVKDNIAVKGFRMTCASKMLANYHPPYNATVVERILREGAIIIGKTNMDEFACGSSGETSAFGPTRNPRDLERVPGGSSSGSAAAVAAGLADLSLASDTGGSIRNPASFCGVFGLKPTYGLVSRYGLADLAMSLDVIGPIAPDVYGLAITLEVIAGKDPKDVRTSHAKLDVYSSFIPIEHVRVGYSESLFEGAENGVVKWTKRALDRLEKEGAEIVEVTLPSPWDTFPAYYLVMYPEFASAMQKFDGLKYGNVWEENGDLYGVIAKERGKLFGREVKRRILFGTLISMKEYVGKWYTLAKRAVAKLRHEYFRVFEEVDIIVSPTVPYLPFKLGERINDPVAMYMSDALTVTANLLGVPALNVPYGKEGHLPVGIQLMGRKFEERLLLSAAKVLEGECPW